MPSTTLSTAEARRRFSDIINRAYYAHEATIIERNGNPVAAVINIEDLQALEALEDLLDLHEARKRLKEAEEEGGTLRFEDFERLLDED